ncbi:MAG TPA: formate dehydrogenase [Methylophilaceae bacterium]|nr:formate dehydrogenase [Methylophilaceae bacterium]
MKALIKLLVLCMTMTWAINAAAKLPPPTPEETQKKQADAEKKAATEEAAKAALEKAQDRVSQRYRAQHKDAPPPVPIVTPAAKTPTPSAAVKK